VLKVNTKLEYCASVIHFMKFWYAYSCEASEHVSTHRQIQVIAACSVRLSAPFLEV